MRLLEKRIKWYIYQILRARIELTFLAWKANVTTIRPTEQSLVEIERFYSKGVIHIHPGLFLFFLAEKPTKSAIF